ncbi:T9SS type A sorting domain-containing protein [Ginsengibacter hankyongi]|uniref:T9SS type A sorting domain-containing protein n=1 Tax=Ginsengibacter hankyongi TaxID=2607284 RepID=A0A5J5ICM9_9BACT|nr:T9SS type A sorting domain-containing protein [Ginsengibacter hankyongi]KAA9037215.1 T9SS type A sorting domain-containing protein [Ginsengibacter hankyongi]
MEKYLHKIIILSFVIFLSASLTTNAQTFEWRLSNPTYSSVDPDGAGPATGSVTFTLQIHTTGATVNNINVLATGWSYQSSAAMIPTTPGCSVVSNPANVTVSAAFVAGGFAYTTVNQCAAFSQTTGGQTFDRTVAGTLDGTGINLTSTWVDVFTATLWTLGNTSPEGGYVIINSGSTGTPGPLSSYSVSDDQANEYPVNSLTYTTPLFLGSPLPVVFTKFDAHCTNSGSVIRWATESESNSNYYELERSTDGNNWTAVARINASGTTSTAHTYQQSDVFSGTALYRIKQVDLDGHFTYTSIISSNCEFNNMGVVLYPVPARDLLNVIIQSDKALKTKLYIIDVVGKIVQKMDVNLARGNNAFQINLKGLASGEYILNGSAPSIQLNKKFNVVR